MGRWRRGRGFAEAGGVSGWYEEEGEDHGGVERGGKVESRGCAGSQR